MMYPYTFLSQYSKIMNIFKSNNTSFKKINDCAGQIIFQTEPSNKVQSIIFL